MKRVLLITNVFPPQIGGPATFIDSLAHGLARDGHRVTVVCTSDLPSDPADAKRPFQVCRIHGGYRLIREVKARMVLTREFLRNTHVLVNGLEYPSYRVARRINRSYVLKVVGDKVWEAARTGGETALSIDNFQGAAPQSSFLRRVAGERDSSVRGAELVITPSNYLKRLVKGWGVGEDRVVTVPNGVPLDEYQDRLPARRTKGPLEVAFCGRLTNWKGVETLLLAAACLRDVRVNIIGDGKEMPMLAGLAEQLRLGERVRFLGRLGQGALREALSRAHLLVLMSQYEGMSHTLLEALAMGLPCIASDCGGNPEVVESGVNGLLLPYGDVQGLRAALERLGSDEELRYGLALKAKESSLRFDFRTTARRTAEVLLNGR